MLKQLFVFAVLIASAAFNAAQAQRENVSRRSELSLPVGSGLISKVNDVAGSPEAKAEAQRLYKEGVKYGRAALYRQAAELFERVVKLDPTYADAHYSLGHAYFDLGEWQQAKQAFEEAVRLNPKDREARARLNQTQKLLEQGTARSSPLREEPKHDDPLATPVSLSSAAPSSSSNAVDNSHLTTIYRVGPGDVLDIRMSDAALMSSTLFTVTPSGLLEHPSLTEPFSVAGLTVEEISERLREDQRRRALSDNPRVSVGVRDYASHTILVSGLVQEPGTKILRREAIPLYVVLADAQPLPEAAVVTLIRSQSEIHVMDITEPEQLNRLVLPGDVLTVQANPTRFFYVAGAVKSPGEKIFRRGMTLTQAIIAAGGLAPKSKEARLARDDGKGFLVLSRFKLKDIDSGKVPDPLIQPGDRITIVD